MATTKTTMTTTTKSAPRPTRQLPQLVTGRITVEAPRSLAGPDAVVTLLPTGGELALYLDDPHAAVEALCLRTHAPLAVGVLAFRTMLTASACA
jgi:hypothetical protein